eukprot:jgi/Bigna1/144257/aug1.85_g18965
MTSSSPSSPAEIKAKIAKCRGEQERILEDLHTQEGRKAKAAEQYKKLMMGAFSATEEEVEKNLKQFLSCAPSEIKAKPGIAYAKAHQLIDSLEEKKKELQLERVRLEEALGMAIAAAGGMTGNEGEGDEEIRTNSGGMSSLQAMMATILIKVSKVEVRVEANEARLKANEARFVREFEEIKRMLKEEAGKRKREAELKQKLSEMKGWTKLPDMNTERYALGVAVGNGKLFAVGGYGGGYLASGEYLDLKDVDAGWKKGWTKIPDMNTKRRGVGVAVGDGKLFAVGGNDGSNRLKNGEYLDLNNMDAGWKKIPDMNTERSNLGVAVGDGKLFAVGGWDGSNTLRNGEYLDLDDMKAGWTKIPEMNTERRYLGVAVGDGKLFAVGGEDDDWNTLRNGEYLDLKNMKAGWTKIPDMNAKRRHLGVAVGDGKLFAVGGWDGSNTLGNGEYLDLNDMKAGWTKIPDMRSIRWGLKVAIGDGKLFAVGGANDKDVPYKSGEYIRIAM